jgi:hypothetical protein
MAAGSLGTSEAAAGLAEELGVAEDDMAIEEPAAGDEAMSGAADEAVAVLIGGDFVLGTAEAAAGRLGSSSSLGNGVEAIGRGTDEAWDWGAEADTLTEEEATMDSFSWGFLSRHPDRATQRESANKQ